MTRLPDPVERPVIGRCPVKGCRYRRRIMTLTHPRDRGRAYPLAWDPVLPGPGRNGTLDPSRTVTEILASRFATKWDAERVAAWRDAGLICALHDRPLTLSVVIGTYDPSRACDGRCMGATGPHCSCACGGMNHGRTWDDVTYRETVAPVEILPAPTPEPIGTYVPVALF